MTITRITQLAAAVLSAAALVAATPSPGIAQQSDKTVRTVKAAKAKPAARKTDAGDGQWTLQHALPDNSAAMRYYAPEPAPRPGVGRVPLQSGPGTFGLATETQSRGDLLPDGRPVPGVYSTSRQTPSYVGLSLSVPTSDKALNIPVPLVGGAAW